MNSNNSQAEHSKVQSLILDGKIYEACCNLSQMLISDPDKKLCDILKHQEETYKYLIHYLVEGYNDNSRDRMLSDISSTLLFINDSILRNKILKDSPDIYSSTLRFEKIRKATIESRVKEYLEAYSIASLSADSEKNTDMRRAADEALVSLFSYIMTMYGASSDDYRILVNLAKDPSSPYELKAQIISALMLGNISYFDKKGFSTLLDIFESGISAQISARSLVAIILIASIHSDRILRDKDLMNRLKLWDDSIVIYRQLREVIMNLIKAQDTQRISSKMQNEVIPELMKLRPEIIKRLGKLSETSDIESLEENPEWEQLINKNGLGDKLRELTEMQMDGGDVMMLAFSNLKAFPFFNSISNWFLPFSADHSEVAHVSGKSADTFSELLENEGLICNSDKYSFVLSLAGMAEEQRKMVDSQMNAQFAQIKEMMTDRMLKSSVPEFDRAVTSFVRDTYRFFKLYRRRSDFHDPFERPVDYLSLPAIGDMLKDSEMLRLIGEFYFKRGYFKEALPIFRKLDNTENADPLLWEKIAYCFHSSGDIENALVWYSKAELLHPDSSWLIRQLAICNRLLSRYETASEYYTKALSSDPDNYRLLINLGNVLLQAGKYSEALTQYYHADYVRPETLSALRGIAWSELLSGNTAKSIETYRKILLTPESTATDYLNIGHAYFLSGDYKNAVASYLNSAHEKDFGIGRLEKAVIEDIPLLKKAGGNVDILFLLLEKVRYDL